MISISVPVRMAWRAGMELLNRAPSREIVDGVRGIVAAGLSDLPVDEVFVRVIQPGRTRFVLVHAVMPSDYAPRSLAEQDALRQGILDRLTKDHAGTVLDLVFTADRSWAAPAGAAQQA